ncbi:HPr(Ser) kinase/phosphatase [Paenibacillus larvae]|uniref:HPr kinase/phosphorylase n=4 Tax=Paenibacillus larvae TaxID=1464 RepID=V9VZJ1_9BACL|nr:HPr(Ser) kinase/phosphatase [Paenibacillus larvae]AHD04096.1 HPr kinase/phosphorylase HprK [Paenibacillus larvae subsp. larvae DSM 25430]AQR78908.1 HPr kinase/phosphorylase [Paenibacillus larvae subsp. larvae]ARF68572.1 HPr kinase/phosphorylase [Paenibacillus larvae subsp. pulvifaciens]AVF24027.1 HPr kinase/phosphorylase HprK [Paenibacillus larvae subsp. larvae]AVG10705.1 HPr kinase/phosphorylase HprK [Paenibacillus larvae subsp. larvae DSM 25430]
MAKKVKVADLVRTFKLEVISGEEGLKRTITVADLYRPGLEMAGYFNYHPQERVQLLGKTEMSFYETLTGPIRQRRARQLCTSPETPCIIITRGLDIPDEIIEEAAKHHLPVLRSKVATTILASRLTNYLENKLAPSTTIHGVLVDVYGVGMLITGGSGIGKSETALELVKRGHRLVADDAVEIRQTADYVLSGNAPELIRHLLEIRGVGIINVMTLFGAGAVRNEKKISVVVKLETWQQDKQYDRLGLDEETTRIIDTDLPLVTIPVRPGRNLAVIIEVAAMNYRLKRMGYNAALQFTNRLTETIAEDLDD